MSNKRITNLERKLKAREGNKAYEENCKAIEAEIERLKNAQTEQSDNA